MQQPILNMQRMMYLYHTCFVYWRRIRQTMWYSR